MTSSTESASAVQDNENVGLSQAQQECLRCIAGHMIPASYEFGVPAANDPVIFADMVSIVDRDRDALASVLATVDEAAGGKLCDLLSYEQAAVLSRLRARTPGMFAVVEGIVARAYYRADAVLASIGMELRPPFPKGFEVEQGDWSLLEPVRKLSSFYRRTD